MNFRDAADDLLGLRNIMSTRGEQFYLDALQEGMKKCEEWNVETSLRTKRKKKMSGDLAADAGLTAQEEIKRVLNSAADCSFSLKFGAAFDYGTADITNVQGQR